VVDGAAPFASSDSADASDSAGGAMDEDDLFVGGMDIDEGAAGGGGSAAVAPGACGRSLGVDEDMSEVAEIMLNLKVSPACKQRQFPDFALALTAHILVRVLGSSYLLRDGWQGTACSEMNTCPARRRV